MNTLVWAAQMFGDPARLLRNLAAEIQDRRREVPGPAHTSVVNEDPDADLADFHDGVPGGGS